MVLAPKPPPTNLGTRRTVPITAFSLTGMASAISHSLTLPVTRQILIARNLFLQSSTPARLHNDSPAGLNAGSSMAPLWTLVEATAQHLITGGAA